MSANLKTTFCVDIEATCWKDDDQTRDGIPNEIIEIGICAYDLKSRSVVLKRSYPVKPRWSSVSQFCTELTGWTQAQVDVAPDIADVLQQVKDDFKITRHHTWWSYGEYDKYKLSTDPKLNGSLGTLYSDIQFSPFHGSEGSMRAHFNVKTLLALKLGFEREVGLGRAMNHLHETFEGRPHNGADDAFNITKIVRRILQ